MRTHNTMAMQNQWNVREEILRAAHRWPLILLCFIVGSLLGFGIVNILPHTYHAEVNLHVSYNADSIFRNPDDYKNWNMEQLNVIVLSENVLQKTLARLAEADPYWKDISTGELANRLQVHWRSVGIWRLVAEDRQPARAVALARVWKEVSLEEISAALNNALIAQKFNDQFIASARAKVDASLRVTALKQVSAALKEWRTSMAQTDPNQPLDITSRWRILSLVAQAAGSNITGEILLSQMPPEGSPLSAYQAWVDQTLVAIDVELPIIQQQLADLTAQSEGYYAQWGEKNHIAYGLSMYLTVEDVDHAEPIAKQVRLDSTAALVGGSLGLVIWCFIWLLLPALKDRR
jgi:hypothetical protein